MLEKELNVLERKLEKRVERLEKIIELLRLSRRFREEKPLVENLQFTTSTRCISVLKSHHRHLLVVQ